MIEFITSVISLGSPQTNSSDLNVAHLTDQSWLMINAVCKSSSSWCRLVITRLINTADTWLNLSQLYVEATWWLSKEKCAYKLCADIQKCTALQMYFIKSY